MKNVAQLSDMACRLLLHLLQTGGGYETPKQAQLLAGMKKTSYFAARAELTRLGILKQDGSIDFPVGHSEPEQDSDMGSIFSRVFAGELVHPSSFARTEIVNTDLPDYLGDKVYIEVAPEPEPEDDSSLVDMVSWVGRAADADRMDPSGDERDVKSPFQARRRAQIQVIQGAYNELLNAMLVGANAKELLRLTGNYAEPVVEAIEQTAGQPKKIEYPLGYIKTILKRQSEMNTTNVMVNRTAIGPTNNDNYYLEKPTERTRKVVERLKQLQAEGKLVLHDDDIPEE